MNKIFRPFVPNYHYPLNPMLKTDEWKHRHKNAMLNLLLANILLLKKRDYKIAELKPESVTLRSQAYLQDSYDIHRIFRVYFVQRDEEVAQEGLYYDWTQQANDTDWSLAKIAQKIRGVPEFHDELSSDKKKELTAKNIEAFFKTNAMYKHSVYRDNHRKADLLRDWRLKPFELEDGY